MANPIDADDREEQPDQLGELQRGYRLTLADRAQSRRDELGEHQAVGVAARPGQCADREDDGLHAEDDRGGQRADAGDEQGGDQHRGGDPGREARSPDVNLIGGLGGST